MDRMPHPPGKNVKGTEEEEGPTEKREKDSKNWASTF